MLMTGDTIPPEFWAGLVSEWLAGQATKMPMTAIRICS